MKRFAGKMEPPKAAKAPVPFNSGVAGELGAPRERLSLGLLGGIKVSGGASPGAGPSGGWQAAREPPRSSRPRRAPVQGEQPPRQPRVVFSLLGNSEAFSPHYRALGCQILSFDSTSVPELQEPRARWGCSLLLGPMQPAAGWGGGGQGSRNPRGWGWRWKWRRGWRWERRWRWRWAGTSSTAQARADQGGFAPGCTNQGMRIPCPTLAATQGTR